MSVLRLRTAALVAAVLLALLASGTAAEVRSAAATEPTTLELSYSPDGTITPYTLVRFHAVVSPASAAGTVRIMANSTAVAVGDVENGELTLTTTYFPLGTFQVTAEFQPTSDAYAASAAPSTTLVVKPEPRLVLTTASGAPVEAGGSVRAGQEVRAEVSGFDPGQVVLLSLQGTSIGSALATDAAGSGHASVPLPAGIASSVYVLSATSGALKAAFAFYVYNPAGPAPSQPPPAPASSPAPAPVAATTTVTSGIPATGSTPSLAQTGTDVMTLLPAGLLALVLGGMLVALTPASVPSTPRLGRHSPGPSSSAARHRAQTSPVGRHARR